MVDRFRADESKGCLPFLSYMCATQWTSVAQNIDIINVLKINLKQKRMHYVKPHKDRSVFLFANAICKI